MSAFTEFVCVAIALYLWESTLWLPLRGIALRRCWFEAKWKVLDPRSLIATRELGLIAMLPFPPDSGLAPCQAPPLLVTPEGSFLMETSDGRITHLNSLTWNDLIYEEPRLKADLEKTRMTSLRSVELLRRAKNRGVTPEVAVRQAWRLALSPARAGREWRRWKLVSGPLRCYGPTLALGVFVGLPLVYLKVGTFQALLFGAWLWCLMVLTAVHLWWLGKRVYPDAKSALRMDALLALLIPFHAMRATEIAAVHAMGTTHPVGLILSSQDLNNPWLGRFVRRILHPMPGLTEEVGFSSALKAPLSQALSRYGKTPEDFNVAPDPQNDSQAARYCPRCHGLFLADVATCQDCRGLKLLDLA
jgi:hypothetical protein